MWSSPPARSILPRGELHIWRISLEINSSYLAGYQSSLAKDELYRASKFRYANDRLHFIAARGILRGLLANYLCIDPKDITFRYGPHGKPDLVNDRSLKFNLTHAAGMALVALTKKHNIGVDLERIKVNVEFEEIAKQFFATGEVKNLLALPIDQRPQGFFNCWTRKEAFIKAKGNGLSFPLDQFEVALKPNEPAELLATKWDAKEASKWSLFELDPGEGFVGAVAIDGPADVLKLWQYDC